MEGSHWFAWVHGFKVQITKWEVLCFKFLVLNFGENVGFGLLGLVKIFGLFSVQVQGTNYKVGGLVRVVWKKVNIFGARFRLVHMGSWVQSTNYKVGGFMF